MFGFINANFFFLYKLYFQHHNLGEKRMSKYSTLILKLRELQVCQILMIMFSRASMKEEKESHYQYHKLICDLEILNPIFSIWTFERHCMFLIKLIRKQFRVSINLVYFFKLPLASSFFPSKRHSFDEAVFSRL